MNNPNSIRPSDPIDIKSQYTKLDVFNKDPFGNSSQVFSPPSNANSTSPLSSVSSFSSVNTNFNIDPQQKAGLHRRLSLNLGSSVFSPFFKTSGSPPDTTLNNGMVSEATTTAPRGRMRTWSTSEAETGDLAAKWGFGIRPNSANTFPRQSKPRPNILQQLHEEAASRPKSPMGDMILNGQFLD